MKNWIIGIFIVCLGVLNLVQLEFRRQERATNNKYRRQLQDEIKKHLRLSSSDFSDFNWIFQSDIGYEERKLFFAKVAGGKFSFNENDSFILSFLRRMDSIDSPYSRKLFFSFISRIKAENKHNDTLFGYLYFMEYLKSLRQAPTSICGPVYSIIINSNDLVIDRGDTFTADIIPFAYHISNSDFDIYVNGKPIPKDTDGIGKLKLTRHTNGFNNYKVELKLVVPPDKIQSVYRTAEGRYFVQGNR